MIILRTDSEQIELECDECERHRYKYSEGEPVVLPPGWVQIDKEHFCPECVAERCHRAG